MDSTIPTALTMYGAQWCGDCRRSKHLLDRLGVDYDYRDLEVDESHAATALEVSGRSSIPVIVLPNGSVLVEPSDRELNAALQTAGLVPN